MATLYTKVFTREFTLAWLEIWYRGEAGTPKPWNGELNPAKPYIVFLRHDGTVTSYYDPAGLEWSRASVLNRVRADSAFCRKITEEVSRDLGRIRPFLDKGSVDNTTELTEFFHSFQDAYPWLLAMWEIGEAEPGQREGLDVADALKLKESTVTLTDDLDNFIRKSATRIYPTADGYTDVLTLGELSSGEIPDTVRLKQRSNGFIYTDATLFPTSQLPVIERIYGISLPRPPEQTITSLKGTVASRGHARGPVRRIMSLNQLAAFAEGDILVSPMTMPDFTPAMSKAAAIVTDEGGITCHAAIIARELGKPCIVGTGIASEVLHDGDVVDVDAVAGIVTVESFAG